MKTSKSIVHLIFCLGLSCLLLSQHQHTQAQGLTVITTPFNVSCNGGSDGLVASLVVGGTPPYSYIWSTGNTSPNISALPAGLYSVTVTDTSGNVGQASAVVNEPPALSLTFHITNAIGSGGSDGDAKVKNDFEHLGSGGRVVTRR